MTAATNTKTYDGTTTAAATPTITAGTLAGTATRRRFTETYDTKNVGTGKTLTPAGSVNDGNGGDNYAITFVNNTTGDITARAITVTAATDTKTYDGDHERGRDPDDHVRHARSRRHRDLHRDLRQPRTSAPARR